MGIGGDDLVVLFGSGLSHLSTLVAPPLKTVGSPIRFL
jgi:hypothetical protein